MDSSILSIDKKPIIELIEEVDNSIWQEREKYWISKYSNLINLTEGGDGCLGFLHDEETRIKCGLHNVGRRHTNKFKEDMSNRLKGVKLTEEHKAKIGNSNRGKIRTYETIQKLSNSHKGIIQSEESKRKKSEAIKAWWAKRKSVEDIVES